MKVKDGPESEREQRDSFGLLSQGWPNQEDLQIYVKLQVKFWLGIVKNHSPESSKLAATFKLLQF